MKKMEFVTGMVAGMVGGMLVSVMLGGRLSATTDPKTVSAEQFVLTDSQGHVRGVFSVQNDMAVLGIQGPDGERLALGVGKGQMSISYVDKNKKNPFTISDTDAQGPVLVLNSLKDKTGIGLGIPGGMPLIYLQDSAAKVRASMMLAQSAQIPMVTLSDADGKLKASLIGK